MLDRDPQWLTSPICHLHALQRQRATPRLLRRKGEDGEHAVSAWPRLIPEAERAEPHRSRTVVNLRPQRSVFRPVLPRKSLSVTLST